MNTVIAQTASARGGIKNILIFFSSMIPFTESKGAILLAAALKIKWYISYFFSFIGSYCVVPVIIGMKKRQPKLLDDLTENVKTKYASLVGYMKKYGCWGLILLISIPFTGIGCWFGALTARLLQLDKKKACTAIFIGNMIGCFLTTMCVYGIFKGIRLLL